MGLMFWWRRREATDRQVDGMDKNICKLVPLFCVPFCQ